MGSRPRPHAALSSNWKFAAITRIERLQLAKVTQAVTESGEADADETAFASRAIIRSMVL